MEKKQNSMLVEWKWFWLEAWKEGQKRKTNLARNVRLYLRANWGILFNSKNEIEIKLVFKFNNIYLFALKLIMKGIILQMIENYEI